MGGAVSGAPAGWYPDPTGRNQLRYWDGQVWSDWAMHGGAEIVDAVNAPAQVTAPVAPAPAAVAPAAAQAAPAPAAAPAHRLSKHDAAAGFEAAVLAAAHGDPDALGALPARRAALGARLRAAALQREQWTAYAAAVRAVIRNDRIGIDDEQRLAAVAAAIGIDPAALVEHDFPTWEELTVAAVHDGRLPVTADASLLAESGEVVRMTFPAVLMKEVTHRELRGGTQGVSLHVAKGVNYRVGGMRAHSVVTGTDLEEQDHGRLVVTSRRAVYVGQTRTLEFRYDKLVSVEQFADGLRLNVSTRQLASTFTFPPGSSPAVAVALISRRE